MSPNMAFQAPQKGTCAIFVIVAHLTSASQSWLDAVRYECISEPVAQTYIPYE
jgi:hypothetical protein